ANTLTPLYFEELMAGFGCHSIGRTAFGVAGALPYSAELVGKAEGKQQFVFRFVLDGAAKPALAFLKEREAPHLRWQSEADAAGDGSVLVATFTPPSDFYAKAGIHGLLAQAQDAAAAGGLHTPEACPLCGQARCDRYACLDGAYRKTHAACLSARLRLPENDYTLPQKVKGNVFTGILGALLGAFIGALPNWAIALSRGQIHWALYVFIPILSAMVYRLLRGKASRAIAGVSVLLASLVAAFALEQVWYWLVLSHNLGHNIGFSVSIASYFSTHNITTVVREMLFCLIALLVGYFVSIVLLRRYAAGGTQPPRVVRGAGFVRESARPIDMPPEDPPGPEAAPEPEN
ncbi:MAG: hypothetical protein AB7V55_05630, partial [Oscillospiraceae bacterium]